MKNGNTIITLGLAFVLGFLVSHKGCTPDPIVEYVPGDTITQVVDSMIPYEVLDTCWLPGIPSKPDTIYEDGDTVIITVTDTAYIVRDYGKLKKYSKVLYDSDTLGFLSVDAQVQYNELTELGYTLVPITKNNITKPKAYTPYVLLTASTLGYVGFGAGVYKENLGLQLKYLTNTDDITGLEIGFVKKF